MATVPDRLGEAQGHSTEVVAWDNIGRDMHAWTKLCGRSEIHASKGSDLLRSPSIWIEANH